MILFHRAFRIVRPITCRTQTVRVARHDRLVLGLGHLVLAQVKALGQGYIVFGFMPSAARFRSRTAHPKCTRRTPDHIIATVAFDPRCGYLYRHRAGGGGSFPARPVRCR